MNERMEYFNNAMIGPVDSDHDGSIKTSPVIIKDRRETLPLDDR